MKMYRYYSILILVLFFSQTGHSQQNRIIVSTGNAHDTISKHIYGHFAEHLGRGVYEGLYVGVDSDIPNTNGIRLDIVEALKELQIPVLRWPGGCFAEQYHWRDGIGPPEDRPLVENMFWGGSIEDNSFGTHEFLQLCELLEAEPYIAVNIASGTVQEASQWIEYVTSESDTEITRQRKANGRDEPWDVKFWGIGNENWGCGGVMNAEYYTNVFKRYSTYCKGAYKIASGGEFEDLDWTRTFMSEMNNVPGYIDMAHGMSYHYYTICNNWNEKGSSTDFVEEEWFKSMRNTLRMEPNLENHISIMDEYDPDNKIALIVDEWGTWYDVEPGTNPGFLYQQNTLRDALVAAIGLNIFNNHAERIKMANIAQTVNVLQAMILTREDQMVKTPTFYVFKMYKVHQDAALLPTEVQTEEYEVNGESIPALSVSASRDNTGTIHLTIANVNPTDEISTMISLEDLQSIGTITGEVITAPKMNSLNDFGKEEAVIAEEFDGFQQVSSGIELVLPSKSIVLLSIAP